MTPACEAGRCTDCPVTEWETCGHACHVKGGPDPRPIPSLAVHQEPPGRSRSDAQGPLSVILDTCGYVGIAFFLVGLWLVPWEPGAKLLLLGGATFTVGTVLAFLVRE